MTTASFNAFLCDLDGTLIDSTFATEKAWAEWGRQLGFTDFSLDRHGVPAKDLVKIYAPDADLDEAVTLINDLELAQTDGIVMKPGVAEFLQHLNPAHWAIVTSCTIPLAKARIAAAGLTPPPLIITADDINIGKPNPEGYLLGASRLGFAPEKCLVLEDAPAGLEAGKAAGCSTLAIAGTHRPEELTGDFLVTSLTQIAVRPDARSYEISVQTA